MSERAALIDAFARGAVVVREAWDRVPVDARRFRPAPGEWSPHELVIHRHVEDHLAQIEAAVSAWRVSRR